MPNLYANLDDTFVVEQYDSYLEEHINNVKRAFEWLYLNMPEIFDNVDMQLFSEQINQHDASKWDEDEHLPYANYFYGKRTDDVNKAFDYAWLHHQHENPHHWEHWVMVAKFTDKIKVLDMPYPFMLEMLCDNWSFAWGKGNLYEIFDWYKKNKDDMILSPNTKTAYETLLNKLRQRLDEMKAKGELY